MERIKRKKKRVLRGWVRAVGFCAALVLVFAVIGGLECGTMTVGLAGWLLGLCCAAMVLSVRA